MARSVLRDIGSGVPADDTRPGDGCGGAAQNTAGVDRRPDGCGPGVPEPGGFSLGTGSVFATAWGRQSDLQTKFPRPAHKAFKACAPGYLHDNIFIERLWRSLKYECVYLHAWETGSQARAAVGR